MSQLNDDLRALDNLLPTEENWIKHTHGRRKKDEALVSDVDYTTWRCFCISGAAYVATETDPNREPMEIRIDTEAGEMRSPHDFQQRYVRVMNALNKEVLKIPRWENVRGFIVVSFNDSTETTFADIKNVIKSSVEANP